MPSESVAPFTDDEPLPVAEAVPSRGGAGAGAGAGESGGVGGGSGTLATPPASGSATTACGSVVSVRAVPGAGIVPQSHSGPSTVLITVEATAAPPVAGAPERAAVDVVLVLDVSGSMQGSKICLVLESVQRMLELLSPRDRVSIVTFNSTAQRHTPLLRVHGDGLAQLVSKTRGLIADGGTSVGAGLRMAQRVLQERVHRNPVAAVMVLSDGCDSGGSSPCGPVATSLRDAGVSVHTWGYGSDHDPALMNSVAEAGGGSFTFVSKLEFVSDSFSACIGAVTDVVAQKLVVHVAGVEGSRVLRVVGCPYPVLAKGDGMDVVLGEMSGGERRDVLVEVHVPESEATATSVSIMGITCTFQRPEEGEAVPQAAVAVSGEAGASASAPPAPQAAAPAVYTCVATVAVARPGTSTVAEVDASRSMEVDEQLNRVACAKAMGDAVALSTTRQFTQAGVVIDAALASLRASYSGRVGTALVGALEADLVQCRRKLASEREAADGGRAYAMQACSSFRTQKGTPSAHCSSAAAMFGTTRSFEYTMKSASKRARSDEEVLAALSAMSPAAQYRMSACMANPGMAEDLGGALHIFDSVLSPASAARSAGMPSGPYSAGHGGLPAPAPTGPVLATASASASAAPTAAGTAAPKAATAATPPMVPPFAAGSLPTAAVAAAQAQVPVAPPAPAPAPARGLAPASGAPSSAPSSAPVASGSA